MIAALKMRWQEEAGAMGLWLAIIVVPLAILSLLSAGNRDAQEWSNEPMTWKEPSVKTVHECRTVESTDPLSEWGTTCRAVGTEVR